jgi:hypothetical protein
MPVYLYNFNLIIPKKTVSEKYTGGIEQFEMDYEIFTSDINTEDDELFSLAQMNIDGFDIEELVQNGLTYDEDNQRSDDFVIIYRYGDDPWSVDWIKHNRVFAWHINANKKTIEKVHEICEMTMDEIVEQAEKGNNLFTTIEISDVEDTSSNEVYNVMDDMRRQMMPHSHYHDNIYKKK